MQHRLLCASPEHVGISTYSQTYDEQPGAMQTMLAVVCYHTVTHTDRIFLCQ